MEVGSIKWNIEVSNSTAIASIAKFNLEINNLSKNFIKANAIIGTTLGNIITLTNASYDVLGNTLDDLSNNSNTSITVLKILDKQLNVVYNDFSTASKLIDTQYIKSVDSADNSIIALGHTYKLVSNELTKLNELTLVHNQLMQSLSIGGNEEELNKVIATYEKLGDTFVNSKKIIEDINNLVPRISDSAGDLNKIMGDRKAEKSFEGIFKSTKNLNKEFKTTNANLGDLQNALNVLNIKGAGIIKNLLKLFQKFGPVIAGIGLIIAGLTPIIGVVVRDFKQGISDLKTEFNDFVSNIAPTLKPITDVILAPLHGLTFLFKKANEELDRLNHKSIDYDKQWKKRLEENKKLLDSQNIDSDKLKTWNDKIFESSKNENNKHLNSLNIRPTLSASQYSGKFNELDSTINILNEIGWVSDESSKHIEHLNKILNEFGQAGFNTQEIFGTDKIVDSTNFMAFIHSVELARENFKGFADDLNKNDLQLFSDEQIQSQLSNIRDSLNEYLLGDDIFDIGAHLNFEEDTFNNLIAKIQELGFSYDKAKEMASNFYDENTTKSLRTQEALDMTDKSLEKFKTGMENLAADTAINVFSTIGSTIVNAIAGTEDLTEAWKDLGAQLLKSGSELLLTLAKELLLAAVRAIPNWPLAAGLAAGALGCGVLGGALGGIASLLTGGNKSSSSSSNDVDDSEYQRRKKWINENVADQYSYDQMMRALENQWKDVKKGGSWSKYDFPSRSDVTTYNPASQYIVVQTNPEVYLDRTKISSSLSQNQIYDSPYGVIGA